MLDQDFLSPSVGTTVVVSDLGDEFGLVPAALIGTRLEQALSEHLAATEKAHTTFAIDLRGVRRLSTPGITVIEDFLDHARRSGVDPLLVLREGSPAQRVLRVLGIGCPSRTTTSVVRR